MTTDTFEAEYADYGPGFNLSARLAGNITRELTAAGYAPYSSPDEVFQFPFNGTFGNTAWIDLHPRASG